LVQSPGLPGRKAHFVEASADAEGGGGCGRRSIVVIVIIAIVQNALATGAFLTRGTRFTIGKLCDAPSLIAECSTAAHERAVAALLTRHALALRVAQGGIRILAAGSIALTCNALAAAVGHTVAVGVVTAHSTRIVEGGANGAIARAPAARGIVRPGLALLLANPALAIAVLAGVRTARLNAANDARAGAVDTVVWAAVAVLIFRRRAVPGLRKHGPLAL
jgi:hypothetical protein